ncbi:MAG: glucose-6-phosphate isomerase [Burkholderiales bacterium]|jgi:glucose-6-phosphate isomerase|nr:glucose-6-phosphate isomerase [Burkholderiales bacterium]
MNTVETLQEQARTFRSFDLRKAFTADRARAQTLALNWEGWRVDMSRQHVTTETLTSLRAHAEALDLRRWIAALFAGEKLNVSEDRSALHTALRQRDDMPLTVGKSEERRNVITDIRAAQTAMRKLTEALRSGHYLGADGQAIRAVVHIGIGGSLLGPRLACDALWASDDFDVRFVANLDPEALRRALHGLDPATTLFVVVSKTFTTEETLANARAAQAWLLKDKCVAQQSQRHFIAVTANSEAAHAFGVPEAQILPFWDWVGGRFSLWSAVGVTLAIQSGWPIFEQLLNGAAAMDRHFREAPLTDNVPVTLALIDWWNTCFLQRRERVIAPYAEALRLLPMYLQQLLMESNGKRVRWDGEIVETPTTTAVWGGIGTDSQHAFFQWLHQGTHTATVEFIVPALTGEMSRSGLAANALAQAQALMRGSEGKAPNDVRFCPGNVASTMLMLPKLDAWQLGALLALYEHRTFIEGVLYGINPFDQFGVEIGKQLAQPLRAALEQNQPLPPDTDAATRQQLDYVVGIRSQSSNHESPFMSGRPQVAPTSDS